MRKLIVVSAICVVVLSSCQTQQSLYSWYDSEDAAYMHAKRGTEETLTKAMAQYELVIAKQKGVRKVAPPGVNAEYGFLLYKAGKKEEGLALLHAEIKAYPESETFISRIINQLEK